SSAGTSTSSWRAGCAGAGRRARSDPLPGRSAGHDKLLRHRAVDHRGLAMGVLEGVTVVEVSIAIAAPSCARMMAFHGADVLRIESRTNPDVARLFGSTWALDLDRGAYMDTSAYVAEMSANKRSVGLERKQPEARAAA